MKTDMKYKSGDEGIWSSSGRNRKPEFYCRIVRVDHVAKMYTLDYKGVLSGKTVTAHYSEDFLDRCFTKYSKLQKAML